MELKDILSTDDKLRIIQELVPGKQITLAHVIASPDPILYTKLGLNPEIDFGRRAWLRTLKRHFVQLWTMPKELLNLLFAR